MTANVKSVLNKHRELIEQEHYEELLLKVGNIFANVSRADEYNEFIDILTECGVFDDNAALTNYSRHHTDVDEDEFEEFIEENIPYEYRCKYIDVCEYSNSFKFLWVSQERMTQEITDEIAVLVNNFLLKNVPYSAGMLVHGVTYCRDNPNRKYEFHYTISSGMEKYEPKLEYHVVFSCHAQENIYPETTFDVTDDEDDAYNLMDKLANDKKTFDDWGYGNIVVLEIPAGATPTEYDSYYRCHEEVSDFDD